MNDIILQIASRNAAETIVSHYGTLSDSDTAEIESVIMTAYKATAEAYNSLTNKT